MFIRLIQGLTGARPKEQLSVLFSFSALLFLLLSYYLVKPLRDSLFFVYFDSTDQAYFSLPIILSSLLAVKSSTKIKNGTEYKSILLVLVQIYKSIDVLSSRVEVRNTCTCNY